MFRAILTVVFMVFLIAVVGNVVLDQFPDLVPLWEEFKMHVVNIYNMSLVKYGALPTLFIIVAIVIMFGTSGKKI